MMEEGKALMASVLTCNSDISLYVSNGCQTGEIFKRIVTLGNL